MHRLYFAAVFCLIAFLELLLIFNSRLIVINVITVVHLLFLIAGLIIVDAESIKKIFFLESTLLKKELVTQEFAEEVAYEFTKIMVVFPSMIFHILGILLLMPALRNWLTENLLSKNII